MEEKILNSIAIHQDTIITLEHIKERVKESETENMRFKIETKHWYGYNEEPFFGKEKHKLEISKYSAIVLLDTAIKLEKERINKLIDMEIEYRAKEKLTPEEN